MNKITKSSVPRNPAGAPGKPAEELTLPERVLLAAHTLEEGGTIPFGAEALVVMAWQQFPRTFGLRGYTEQYPDSNRCLATLMGDKGLVKTDHLDRMGPKLYRLTRKGKAAVAALRGVVPEPEPKAAPVALTKAQRQQLTGCLASHAWALYDTGRKAELKFADAVIFWGLRSNEHGPAVTAHVAAVGVALLELEERLGGETAVLSDGREITGPEVRMLRFLHDAMVERFAAHLTLLTRRPIPRQATSA